MSAHSDIRFIAQALNQNLIEAILPALREKNLNMIQTKVYHLLSNIAAETALPDY